MADDTRHTDGDRDGDRDGRAGGTASPDPRASNVGVSAPVAQGSTLDAPSDDALGRSSQETSAPVSGTRSGPSVTTPSAPRTFLAPPVDVGAFGFLRRDRGERIALSILGALVACGAVLMVFAPRKPDAPVTEDRTVTPTAAAPLEPVPSGPADAIAIGGAPSAGAPVDVDAGPRAPAFRVASLASNPGLDVTEIPVGKRSVPVALAQAGLSKLEIRRLMHAFEGVHRLDRAPARSKTDAPSKETMILVRDKAKGNVVAFELVASPFDVWQAQLDEASADKQLVARKVDLAVEHRRVSSALVIRSDLAKTVAAEHLREEALDAIDDALEGHVDPTALKPGARLRVVATEDWVEGSFARYRVDALEFVPRSGPPMRVYGYERKPAEGSRRRASFSGYFDAKGQKPYRGVFRSPLPFTRVTSRFNPKRMHPVLHTVMPHNGVDFGATTGTPVFASADGTVSTVGSSGRCGNMVQIEHAGGLSTAYCHLSKFAPGLHGGQHVEARQLVGYVGMTGSATGPHLHFAVKKGGAFIDPLSIKIDGVRVLPPSDREPFAQRRAELDPLLDGTALPSADGAPEEPEKDEPAGEED